MSNNTPQYITRFIDIFSILKEKSCFLFGPRQTGKTSLIHHIFQDVPFYNLLDSPTFLKLSHSPHLLKEEIPREAKIVVIDEIQKLPHLLDQVHLLIEERRIHFLLTGSSARKLRRGGANLLGGRARSRMLHPFIYKELGSKFDLSRALNVGLLPSIYFSNSPDEDLESYASNYLKEEIASEGLTRNIPAFSRFLEVAALCNAKLINFTEIGNDAQVPRSTIHEYFEILKDTLIAFPLHPWKKSQKRKPTATDKFYFFDSGVVRFLQHRSHLNFGTPEFGDAFETYLFHELRTFSDYRRVGDLNYWRSQSGFEVDFILADKIAIEVKAKKNINSSDLKGLKALQEEKKLKYYILVCLNDPSIKPRFSEGVHILPFDLFLDKLWAGEFE
ncbi:MAG: ATP-binding protein [Deltaproteobacteria bacterium]|nr:ATP-binding protein [Deltaproteobacteria bacterium]